MKRKNEFKLSDAILYWKEKNGLNLNFRQQELKEKWEEMMGESIASKTKKIEIKEDMAIIYLNSKLLQTDFNYKKEWVLTSINKQLSLDIKSIDFKLMIND